MTILEFKQKQLMPYDAKVIHARKRAEEFYNEITANRGANVHVSVGGLDSITLLIFLRKYIDEDIPAVSVSTLEDKGNQQIHSNYRARQHLLCELGWWTS